VLVCLGAGGKSDPTKVRLGALTDSKHDPLATKVGTSHSNERATADRSVVGSRRWCSAV
jgi:tRNA A37 threonylcarbamoyladenosine dehydratase